MLKKPWSTKNQFSLPKTLLPPTLNRSHRIPSTKVNTFLNKILSICCNFFSLPVVVSSSEPKGFIKATKAFKNGQFDEVVSACNEEIEKSEDDSEYKMEAILLRGTFYLLSGQFEKSLADFNQVINHKDADPKLRSNALTKRASLHMQTDQREDSFSDFAEAIKLDPENPDIYHHRGQVYLLVEQLEDAVNDFTRASDIAPKNPITYVHKLYSEYRQAVNDQDNTKLFSKVTFFWQYSNALKSS